MKNIYKKYWLIGVVFMSFLSCNNDTETLFPDSPAERIQQSNSELLNLLLAEPNGYKGVYFPKNDEFGGFTFFMKFNADGTVEMTSDFDSDTAIQTSSYEVRYGTTTELVFTTRNHIQKVSNPNYPGLIGTGFKGTSVFQYFGNDNGIITLKDVRNVDSGSFVLTPSGLTNFTTESVIKAEASLAQRQNILPKASNSVFQVLKIEKGDQVFNFNFNYDAFRLYASPRVTLVDNDVISVEEFKFGIAFTEDGLIISPALEFDGEVYENFTYDADSSSYISTVNGSVAKILFDQAPAFLTDDVEAVGKPGHQVFGSYLYFGASPLTSPGFNELIDTLNQNIVNLGSFAANWSYSGFEYYAQPDADGNVNIYIGVFDGAGTTYYGGYSFNQTIENNKLYLQFNGSINGNGDFFFDALIPILQFFNSSNGLYFADQGSFSSDLYSYSNLSSTFTSADQPNLRVYGLWYN
ncbi:DUF4302 domain-containing protein [Yeosuana marina]|uniref:DUF4302 domain-containing protein n=1 Tax=Yeosuana marina TaxID=1565536 RepID=UPI0030C82186